jgi:type I restriction enzyme S subunit
MTTERFFEKFELIADARNAVAQMRELVLELAMQGRLVDQVAAEGDGHTLLKKIHQENPPPAIDGEAEEVVDAEAFKLPSSWAQSRLGEVAEIVRGVTFPGSAKSTSRSTGDVACLRTASVQSEIDWDDLIYISPEYVSRPDQWVAPSDIIISMANSYDLVGKVAIVRTVPQKATFGGFLAAIRPILIEPYFLLYALRSPRMQQAFRVSSSQTTNIANISLGRMRPLPFPLPPLAEQKRIVAKVDELMGLCDRLQAQQAEREQKHAALARASLARFAEAPTPANLQFLFHNAYSIDPADLRKSILTLAVKGKLVAQDKKDEAATEWLEDRRKTNQDSATAIDDAPFNLPLGWAWTHVGSVFEVAGGIQKTPLRAPKNNAYPYLGVGNVYRSRLDLTNVKKFELEPGELDRRKLVPGDLLIIEGNGSFNEIGRCAKWRGEIKDCVHQNHVIRCRPFDDRISDFVLLFLNSPSGMEIMQRMAITSSGLYSLSVGKIRLIAIPLPPLAEQRRIVAKVDQLMALVDQLEAQLAASRDTADKLLEAVVAELTHLPSTRPDPVKSLTRKANRSPTQPTLFG